MALKLANVYTVSTGILTESTPNVAAPRGNRVSLTPSRGGANYGGDFDLYAFLKDGTSIVATVWVKAGDEWYQVKPAATVTPNLTAIFKGIPPESEVFVQMTSPAGTPTSFGYAFV